MPKKKKPEYNGLTDMDETLLFMTRPYMIFSLLCWLLSLYCIISLRKDTQSMAFVLSAITIVIDSVLITTIYYKAKRVRKKKNT
ncbi:MAG: hypothetical protein E7255_06655 [Lachnospiraceae bacterium]|nr:hypothetical protein [Lachnospiraceae bacterium]